MGCLLYWALLAAGCLFCDAARLPPKCQAIFASAGINQTAMTEAVSHGIHSITGLAQFFFAILICLKPDQLPLIKVIFLFRSFQQITSNTDPWRAF